MGMCSSLGPQWHGAHSISPWIPTLSPSRPDDCITHLRDDAVNGRLPYPEVALEGHVALSPVARYINITANLSL